MLRACHATPLLFAMTRHRVGRRAEAVCILRASSAPVRERRRHADFRILPASTTRPVPAHSFETPRMTRAASDKPLPRGSRLSATSLARADGDRSRDGHPAEQVEISPARAAAPTPACSRSPRPRPVPQAPDYTRCASRDTPRGSARAIACSTCSGWHRTAATRIAHMTPPPARAAADAAPTPLPHAGHNV